MDIINILKNIQPEYEKLNSNYSKSYLQGSIWYVGDDLLYWWEKKCNHVHFYHININKIKAILEIILINKKKLIVNHI